MQKINENNLKILKDVTKSKINHLEVIQETTKIV